MQDQAQAASLLIEGIIGSLPERLANNNSDRLESFINQYYRKTPESDLSIATPEDFGGAAISHWQLLQRRNPRQILVRVFNPRVEQHGWQSAHTVIELVTDDMPYLVNSVSMVITQSGFNIHLTVHPILQIQRDEAGKFVSLADSLQTEDSPQSATGAAESLVHFQIDRIVDEDRMAALQQKIESVIYQVTTVFEDNEALLLQPQAMAEKLKQHGKLDEQSTASLELLQWLDNAHFRVFGSAEYKCGEPGSCYESVDGTALGLMRTDDRLNANGTSGSNTVFEEVTANATFLSATDTSSNEEQPLITIGKANVRSPLNRPEALDVITYYNRDDLCSHTIVGLFTQNMNNRETNYIPLLKDKTRSVLTASGLDAKAHDGKALLDTMENLPRDMLFQAEIPEILDIASGIVNLQERQRIKLFGSLSSGGMYYNCLVYIPRDNYGGEIRRRIQSILLSELNGKSCDFAIRFSSQRALARLHFIVQLTDVASSTPDWNSIEQRIVQASISWDDRLHEALLTKHDEDEANRLFDEYRLAFPSNYKEDYSAQIARSDISFIENHVTGEIPVMSFYRHILTDVSTVNFKIFSPLEHIALSDVIPVIENMGLKVDAEHPFLIKRKSAQSIWIHEFTAQHVDGHSIDPEASSERMQSAFEQIWTDRVENDEFKSPVYWYNCLNSALHPKVLQKQTIAALRIQLPVNPNRPQLW